MNTHEEQGWWYENLPEDPEKKPVPVAAEPAGDPDPAPEIKRPG